MNSSFQNFCSQKFIESLYPNSKLVYRKSKLKRVIPFSDSFSNFYRGFLSTDTDIRIVSSLPTTRINLNFDKEVEKRKEEKSKSQVDIASECGQKGGKEVDCFDRCGRRMFPEYIREKLNYRGGKNKKYPATPFLQPPPIVERNYYSTATFLRPLPGQTNFVSPFRIANPHSLYVLWIRGLRSATARFVNEI